MEINEDNHNQVTMVNVALNAIFTNTLVYFTIRTPLWRFNRILNSDYIFLCKTGTEENLNV